MSTPAISLVIPCYRDEHGLPALLETLAPVMDELPGGCELVLVDDGSPDRTGPRAVELARGFRHPATVVLLARNFGQHPAVFAGFEHARGDVVVTLDSDLQYPPDQIRLLIDNLSPEHPVVSGYRQDRQDPWLRKVMTRRLSGWLSRRTGSPLKDYGSMFRAYDRSVIEQLLVFRERRRFVPALVGWLGVDVLEVPVRHEPRGERGSRYRLLPLVDMLIDLITGYATFPMRVVTAVGLLGAALGFIATVAFTVYRIVAGSGISGLVSAFALLFGLATVQLFILALLGEYVGRIYIEAKGRPYYLVREVVRNR